MKENPRRIPTVMSVFFALVFMRSRLAVPQRMAKVKAAQLRMSSVRLLVGGWMANEPPVVFRITFKPIVTMITASPMRARSWDSPSGRVGVAVAVFLVDCVVVVIALV